MSTLRRNILYNVAGQGLLMVLGLVAVRLVFRQLGPDAFGIILFAQTMGLVLASVLELGISATIVREVAAHIDDDEDYVWQLLGTASLFYWGAYAVVTVLVIAASPILVTHWLTVTTLYPASAARLVQILAAGALLALPRSLYASLFRGVQSMGVTNAIEVGAIVVQLLGTIVILTLHGNAFWVASWFTASFASSIVTYLVVARRAGVPAQALLPRYSAGAVRKNLRFALQMVSISALGTVHGQSDKLLVSKLLPVRALGTYGFAATMVASASRLVSSVVQAAFPALAEHARQRDRAELMRRYRRVHVLITFGAAPLFAAVVFAAEPVLRYAFDPAIARDLMLPTAFLCLGSYMNATLSAPYIVSLALGRPDITARQNLYALFVVLPLASLSVWRFGLVGAGFSWVIYHLFAYAYGLPRICRECLEMPPWTWFLGVLQVMVVAVAVYGPAYLLASRFGSTVLALAVGLVVSSAAYAGVGYLLSGRELRGAAGQLAGEGRKDFAA
jgi:O-antigen/teichoic acid export membrane protein